MISACQKPALPVPPNSVRVWQGFRRNDLSQAEFYLKLGSLFIPGTVQIQSLVGLTAYLPSVLPADKPDGVPDEIALVFYAYPAAYEEAKQTVGGRAYSDLHSVAFDLGRSLSGFPTIFDGRIEINEKYFLFDWPVDWQRGHATVFVGAKPPDMDGQRFRAEICRRLKEIQNQRDAGPDAAIVSAGCDYVVYWEHWPHAPSPGESLIPLLTRISHRTYQQACEPYELYEGLWDSYGGVKIKGGESFNFQFSRHVTPPVGSGKVKSQKAIELYDHRRFGPILGVSDEGSAARAIVEAAYDSAKAHAIGYPNEFVVGVIVDGERMGSAGELPVGPDEFRLFFPPTEGRTFSTTNVGVRVNTRILQPFPEFSVAEASQNEDEWLKSIFAKFSPFIQTPDGIPRPLTVRLLVKSDACREALRRLVPKIEAARTGDKDAQLGPRELHRLSFLAIFNREIGAEEVSEIRALLKLANQLKVPEVAFDGDVLDAAHRRIFVQGVLNVLDTSVAQALLSEANALGVNLVYHFEVDQETAARTVWTGLSAARTQGLTAAKYGLLPLTFDQQKYVVEKIQEWIADSWTPIPAFYVDTSLVAKDTVYDADRVVDAAKLWMKMISDAGVRVALVDAPDRINERKLLKTNGGANDIGVLSLEQVRVLTAYADSLELKVLWSGGIKAAQAFELGKLGVGGIFTTGSASHAISVCGTMQVDKQLARQAEPCEVGVQRIHALLQAGFLIERVKSQSMITKIKADVDGLLQSGSFDEATREAVDRLNDALVPVWKAYWSNGKFE